MTEPVKTEHEIIAELAFLIFEQEGRPEGREEEHWLRAEQALKQLRINTWQDRAQNARPNG